MWQISALIPPILYIFLYFIGWFSGGKCNNKKRLDGKIVVITGGNTGIGYETALDLSKRGAKIIMGCRDMKKAQKACEKMGSEACVFPLDLASFASVKKFADEVRKVTEKVDFLINNAGKNVYF